MKEPETTPKKTTKNWLVRQIEHLSHLNTLFDLISGPGKWLFELPLTKFAISAFVSLAFGIWSFLENLETIEITFLIFASFAVSIWILNGAIWGYGRLLRTKLPNIRDGSSRPKPQEIDPYQADFKNVKIRLCDLIFSGPPVISGKHFRNCKIYGPAFLSVRHNLGTFGTTFHGGKVIIRSSDTDKKIAGVIFVENVLFIDCEVYDVSIITNDQADLKVDF